MELVSFEDVPHVTGDPGIGALGVRNDGAATSLIGANNDYGFIALNRAGAPYTMPVFGAFESQNDVVVSREDSASGNLHAGFKTLVVRDDVLIANAEVSADGDYTYGRVDNFGSGWAALTTDTGARLPATVADGLLVNLGTNNDVVISDGGNIITTDSQPIGELTITELIGIDERVDASEYGASVATTLSGTGEIVNICLFATEDGTGVVRTPSGTLLLFNADPATVAGDVAITAAERITILAHFSLLSTDYQFDANGASNCQATTEVYNTGTLFTAFFLAGGEASFNDMAGDDEQLELSVLFRRDS